MAYVPLPLSTEKAKEIEARFWPKVKRGREDECWPWQSSISRGYGMIFAWKRPQYAHRVAYALGRGALSLGDHVLHRCDNTICCNPGHLFLGSHGDNMRDKVAKGRANARKGSAHQFATIDEQTALAIFNDPGTTVDVAARYGVSQVLVYAVRSGRRWGHVTGKKREAA